MRIMFLTTGMRAGGSERRIAALANEFAKNGHEVSVFTANVSEPPFYEFDERVEYITADHIYTQSKNILHSIRANFKRTINLRRIIKRQNPDVIVCFFKRLLLGAFAARLTVLKNKPAIIGGDIGNPYLEHGNFFWRMASRPLARMADGYIAQTQRGMDFYPASVQKKGAVIHNAVFADSGKYKRTGDPKNKICAMGRLCEEKDFATLIKAFAIFNSEEAVYTLCIYGEGDRRTELESLARELGLEGSVVMPGNIAEPLKEMADAGIFVLSSRREGMPNALIEAMSIGLPCISTDCPMGPAELITSEENGLLVPVGDEAAMAVCMKKIAGDRWLAERLGKNALEINRTHAFSKIYNQYYEYIKSVISKKKHGSERAG